MEKRLDDVFTLRDGDEAPETRVIKGNASPATAYLWDDKQSEFGRGNLEVNLPQYKKNLGQYLLW